MPIRINENKKEIVLSVTELAAAEEVRTLTPFSAAASRLTAGRKIHSAHQADQAAWRANYQKEVPIDLRIPYQDYTFVVQGRIDGIYEDDGLTVVEEVKSVIMAPHEFPEIDVQKYPNYLNQLKIYCYLLEKTGYSPVSGILVVVNLVDQNKLALPIEYQAEEAGTFIYRRFDTILREIRILGSRQAIRKSLAAKIVFPFESVRLFQQDLIQDVQMALNTRQDILISASTGIGKTAAVLFPALQFVLQTNRCLFYTTSKTTQQRIVQQTIALINQQKDVLIRAITLQAKEKICPLEEQICHEAFCPLVQNYFSKKFPEQIFDEILALGNILPDTVKTVAEQQGICPFEFSLDLSLRVDVIIGDYNYVFDPQVSLKRFFDQPAKKENFVLIIDEAHNLYPRGREYFTHEIHRDDVQQVIYECRKHLDPVFEELTRIYQQIDLIFHELETDISYTKQNKILFEPNVTQFQTFRLALDELMLEYATFKKLNQIFSVDDPLDNFYFQFTRFENSLSLQGEEFDCIFDRSVADSVIKIFCKDPANQLRQQLKKFYVTIAMSATLEPMSFYQTVLGFSPDAVQRIYPSPFPPENRKIIIFPNVSTRYKHRERAYEPIAELIQQVIQIRPGNYAAFFPSFAFLDRVAELIYPGEYEIIRQHNYVSEAERQRIIQKLQDESENRLILAVQGGIFSEGVDYPGSMLIGAFVISPALPAYTFEQELMKQYYQEKYDQGFEYAYLFPGMNRVIQAVGRVIRTETDQGIIILIGQRFATEYYNSLFPTDWFRRTPMELINDDVISETKGFWESHPV